MEQQAIALYQSRLTRSAIVQKSRVLFAAQSAANKTLAAITLG